MKMLVSVGLELANFNNQCEESFVLKKIPNKTYVLNKKKKISCWILLSFCWINFLYIANTEDNNNNRD